MEREINPELMNFYRSKLELVEKERGLWLNKLASIESHLLHKQSLDSDLLSARQTIRNLEDELHLLHVQANRNDKIGSRSSNAPTYSASSRHENDARSHQIQPKSAVFPSLWPSAAAVAERAGASTSEHATQSLEQSIYRPTTATSTAPSSLDHDAGTGASKARLSPATKGFGSTTVPAAGQSAFEQSATIHSLKAEISALCQRLDEATRQIDEREAAFESWRRDITARHQARTEHDAAQIKELSAKVTAVENKLAETTKG